MSQDHHQSETGRGIPQRTCVYEGRFTDTSRWDSFQMREDDIFVCTPPKCGTTWTQAICALLIFDTPDYSGKLTNISPWLDSKLDTLENFLANLESQKHRRFLKTHTPLDGIPYFPSCQYLIVYRDPRDAYFSLRNQRLNMIDPPDTPIFSGDPQEGFLAWVNAPHQPGEADQRSLQTFTQHYESFRQYQHLKNFHFFHYVDMKRDLEATMRRIAHILDIRVSDKNLARLCHAASFAEMKKSASSYAPTSGKSIFKSDTSFFSSGQNSQWRDALDSTALEVYNSKIRALLPPADIAWIEDGAGNSV